MVYTHQGEMRITTGYSTGWFPSKDRLQIIGCGFGPLCYMLSQLSEEREITGIDYDEDKIAVAQHGWLRTPRLQFVCAMHWNTLCRKVTYSY